jgi:hypothetical protein
MPVGSKPEFLRFRLSLDLSFFGFFKAAIHLDQSPFLHLHKRDFYSIFFFEEIGDFC